MNAIADTIQLIGKDFIPIDGRIPSLIVAPNGDLLVFCEARKTNLSDDGDIDLLMKRSTDDGAKWLPQELIYEEGGDARIKYGNPTAVVEKRKASSGWRPIATI